MSDGLADTSLFMAAIGAAALRQAALPDRIAISVVTLGELRASLLVPGDLAVQDRRLAIYLAAARMDAIPIDADVATAWARLRADLHLRGRTLRANAAWIAATAIAIGVPVLAHGDEFEGIPDLEVIAV